MQPKLHIWSRFSHGKHRFSHGKMLRIFAEHNFSLNISINITTMFEFLSFGDFVQLSTTYFFLSRFQVLNLTRQYVAVYKDPYLMDPPNWYKVFVFSELGLQLPFFFVATIAFMLGRYQVLLCSKESYVLDDRNCCVGNSDTLEEIPRVLYFSGNMSIYTSFPIIERWVETLLVSLETNVQMSFCLHTYTCNSIICQTHQTYNPSHKTSLNHQRALTLFTQIYNTICNVLMTGISIRVIPPLFRL